MKNTFRILMLACLSCSSDDSGPCADTVGTWALVETITDGDCQPVGEIAQTSFVVASNGSASIRDDEGGVVNCTGKLDNQCAGTFTCTADYEVEGVEVTAEAVYTLSFNGDAVTGSLRVTGSGGITCTSDAAVIGSK